MTGIPYPIFAVLLMSFAVVSCDREPELSPFEQAERRYNYLKSNNGSTEAQCKEASAAEAAAVDELSGASSSRSARQLSDMDRVIWTKRKLMHCDFKQR